MAMAFATPVIFGALSDGAPTVDRAVARALSSRVEGAVLLPFQVDRRHLRNIVACMRLMDIQGLIVQGAHRTAILKHLTKLDPLARRLGHVDTVARRGRGFVGFSSLGLACLERLREQGVKGRREIPEVKSLLQRVPRALAHRAAVIGVTVLTTAM